MPGVTEKKRKQVKNNSNCAPCCVPRAKKTKHAMIEGVVEKDEYIKTSTSIESEPPAYVSDLPESLEPGTSISIRGFVKPDCSRFAINFLSDRNQNADIALHINPRLSQRYIVRNSRINNIWGQEETTTVSKFYLRRAEKFTLDIVITSTEFLAALNGKHIFAFVFRIPLAKVKVLQVEGEVDIYESKYGNVNVYPNPDLETETLVVPTGEGEDNKDCYDQKLDIPVLATLPEGFQAGWQLEIYGRVKILPGAFYINLQDGVQLWPHPTIHLHLNPRFNATVGKHLFVRNSWINGEWGMEERSSGFLFSPGSSFSIAIRKSDEHFSVWVDGRLAGEFKFRGTTDNITTVYIYGDVFVNNIYMNQKVNDKYFTHRDTMQSISL